MAEKILWSTVISRATDIANKIGEKPDDIAEKMRKSFDARGIEIDYGDELDFTSQVDTKTPQIPL